MDALTLETRSQRYLFREATERFAQIGMVLCTAVTVFFLLTILGSVAYAFIMIPIILITSHEAFRLVPSSLREASLALGVPKWRTILGVVLPVSSRALLTGAVLAVSRALGEAAPMLFTAFGNPFWNLNLKKPIATVPLLIYTYATGPYDDWHKKAWAASFVLMMVVLFTSFFN